MKTIPFSFGEAFGVGWKATKKNFWFFAGVLAIFVLPSVIIDQAELGDFSSVIIGLVLFIYNLIVGPGIIYISLQILDQKKVSLTDLFSQTKFFFPFLFLTILVGLSTAIGLALLIVPGLIMITGFFFSSYFVVEKKLSAIESMKQSWSLTKGVRWQIFLLWLLIILLNVVGILTIVGIFFAFPISLMAQTFVYRKLITKEV